MVVAVVMGSTSDHAVMASATDVLTGFGVPCDVLVVSAHRTPERLFEFARRASNNYRVVIAGAGGAAHLPGMVAAITTLPVIGVPISVGPLQGLDSLLSIAQMPKGVPVATVAIGAAANAALLAVRILALGDGRLAEALLLYQQKMADDVPQHP
jgi:phosphoribosylaminoimidazole carboxylase PurE protein